MIDLNEVKFTYNFLASLHIEQSYLSTLNKTSLVILNIIGLNGGDFLDKEISFYL